MWPYRALLERWQVTTQCTTYCYQVSMQLVAIEGQWKQGGSRWQHTVSFYHASQEEENWQKKEFVLTLCVIQQWRLFCPLRCVDSSFPVAFFFLFSRTLFFDLVCLSFDYVPQVTFVFVPSFFSGVELVRCVECCCIHSASCRIWSSINMKPKTSSSASWWLPSSSSSSGRKTKARTHKEVCKPLKRVASNPPQHLVSLNFEVCQRLVQNHGLSLSNLAWQFERKAGNQQRRCRTLQKNSGSTAAFFLLFLCASLNFCFAAGMNLVGPNGIESTSIFYHRCWTFRVWGQTCPTIRKSGTEEGRKNKGENMVPRFNRFKELNVGCHLRGFKGISAPDPCHPACPKEAAERIQYLTWRPAFSGDREGARKSTFNGRM